MYYIGKVKIATDSHKGGVKWSTETYLVQAETVTHAEALIVKDFEGSGIEFDVKSVSASKICKVIK